MKSGYEDLGRHIFYDFFGLLPYKNLCVYVQYRILDLFGFSLSFSAPYFAKQCVGGGDDGYDGGRQFVLRVTFGYVTFQYCIGRNAVVEGKIV
jgi:hypothetical protein